MGLVWLLLALLQAAGSVMDPGAEARFPAPQTLAIRVTAAQPRVLVGEPVVLWVEYLGSADYYQGCHLMCQSNRTVWIAAPGSAYQPHTNRPLHCSLQEEARKVRIEGTHRCTAVLVGGQTGNWALPRPGRYWLVYEYSDPELGAVRSNPVSVEAFEPRGDDRTVLGAVRWPFQSAPLYMPDPLYKEIVPLVERYPRSPYLRLLRVSDLEAGSWTPEERMRLARELFELGGPWAPRAGLVLAGLHENRADHAAQRATLGDIVEDYPVTWEADRARDWLAELDRPAR